MNEVYLQMVSYIRGVWRRRWYVIAIAWLVSGAGWTTVASLPDRYQSSARIYIDMDTMLGPLMKGLAVEMNLFQQIDIMRRTLLSRPNLDKIILMTDLDLTIKNDEDKEALVNKLASKIIIKQEGRNLFAISYEDTERALTKRVVQSVMQIFVEGNLGASRKDMEITRRFLEGQIRDYDRQLVETESRLANFKRENIGLLPGGGNYYSNMQNMRAKLSQTEGRIGESVKIRDELSAQLKNVPQFLEVSSGAGLGVGGPESDRHIRILEIQRVIDSLLSSYTENHPDVRSAKRRLAALQKQLQDEQQSTGPGSSATGRGAVGPGRIRISNPVYEQIKLQLVQQESVIAALRNRAVAQRKSVEKWVGMARLVPQVEAQLVRLSRDYEIVKKGYGELRQRQESARLARELETKAQKVQFRIIDPPKLPITPSGPNRPLLFTVILAVGLIAGTAFAFLLGQITTTFATVQRLREAFSLPVLGSITAIVSLKDKRRNRREIFGFAIVCMFLLAAYGSLVTIETIGGAQLVAAIRDLGVI